MDITFLGAAREVTGSCHLVRVGDAAVALDFGLFQGHRAETQEKNVALPFTPNEVSGIVLSRNDAEASNTLHVNVTAQQFAWSFSYPDAHNATSPVLRLPEGRSVELDMRSLDVVHAFFVPQFRTNEDLVPGLVTTVHITPDRTGTFPLICNELCGLGHSLMRTQAIVMKPSAFDSWLKQQKQSTKG